MTYIEQEKALESVTERLKEVEEQLRQKDMEIQKLHEEIARLKSQLNNNSQNSSKAPSSDQNQKGNRSRKAANKYNGRKNEKKKAGGQNCHPGKTRTKKDVEKKLSSGEYEHKIEIIGDTGSGSYITKYKLDLEIKPVIVEVRIYGGNGKQRIPKQYKADVSYGPKVKALAVALYSEGVMSIQRITELVNSMGVGGFGLSTGSVYHFCADFARRTEAVRKQLEQEQLSEHIVTTDATNIRVNGKQQYIRNASTARTVLYYPLRSKAVKGLEEIGFFKLYDEIFMHDHESALYHFAKEHAECNVHLLRYLRKNTEETKHSWSSKMMTLLCEMNCTRKEKISQGAGEFTPELIREYEKRYFDLLEKGQQENRDTPFEYARKEELALLNRMKKYSRNHLLFLHDFQIPFDNNMSERDLRKAKNRQKMSGGFRKSSGHELYCQILTIIETAKRRGLNLLRTIEKVFSGSSDVLLPA